MLTKSDQASILLSTLLILEKFITLTNIKIRHVFLSLKLNIGTKLTIVLDKVQSGSTTLVNKHLDRKWRKSMMKCAVKLAVPIC
jgi:hypothetical protein